MSPVKEPVKELQDSFAQLLGRQATDEERQHLYRVRDALGIKNNDALWLVLMALQHYQSQYEQFPRRIEQAAKEALIEVKTTADAAMQASAQSAKADLAQAVATTAQQVARHSAAKQMWQWATGCILLTTLAIGGLGFYLHSIGYNAGYDSGHAAGYAQAQDEKAAAAWANTPEGRAAYQLAQATSIRDLRSCHLPGWKIENGYCYPLVNPKDGKIWGWQIPP